MREMAYEAWERYQHAEFMNRVAFPFIQATAYLDVTSLRLLAKAQGISFYLSLVWLSSKVIEAREDFRWRLRKGRVALIDHPEPSFTDMMAGTALYKIVHAGTAGEDMAAYARHARSVADAQTYFFPTDEEEARDDYTYFSSTPGAAFVSLTQPMGADKDNFIPQMAWSRFEERDGRLYLPYAVQANHRQVDGFHVARFFADMQAALDALNP